jgi:hypothetical protein
MFDASKFGVGDRIEVHITGPVSDDERKFVATIRDTDNNQGFLYVVSDVGEKITLDSGSLYVLVHRYKKPMFWEYALDVHSVYGVGGAERAWGSLVIFGGLIALLVFREVQGTWSIAIGLMLYFYGLGKDHEKKK